MERTRASGHPAELPLQPLRAWRALRKLRADPNDTAQVFEMIDALSGRTPERLVARLARTSDGQRLLRERPDILPLLRDRAALERMPKGSLAHAYLAFIDREQIDADGLVAASTDCSRPRAPEFAYARARLRDTHDLWHCVTGYHGDVSGEIALLAFNVAQIGNLGVALIVLTSLVKMPTRAHYELVARAFAEGLRAAWLPAAHWETLLPLPLAEVRASLRIRPAPPYTEIRVDSRGSMQTHPLTSPVLDA